MKLLSVFKIVFLAVLLLLFWGCQGANSYNQPYSPPPFTNNNPISPSSLGNLVVINIPPEANSLGDKAFGLNPLTVNAGATVMWINNDSMDHSVTSDSALWDSGPIKPGSSFSFIVSVPGTYTYHCTLHPTMTGTLQVVAAPGYNGPRF